MENDVGPFKWVLRARRFGYFPLSLITCRGIAAVPRGGVRTRCPVRRATLVFRSIPNPFCVFLPFFFFHFSFILLLFVKHRLFELYEFVFNASNFTLNQSDVFEVNSFLIMTATVHL